MEKMSPSELTLGKIVQRFLLYIGIALAVLAVFAVAGGIRRHSALLPPMAHDLVHTGRDS